MPFTPSACQEWNSPFWVNVTCFVSTYFTCETLQRLGKYSPSTMLKSESMLLLHPGWTIVIHYNQDILVILWGASIQNAADRILSHPNPTCEVLKDQAASYLEELIVPYLHNSSLFSQNADLFVVPRISSSIKGGWALSCQASCCWTSSLFRYRRLTRSLL